MSKMQTLQQALSASTGKTAKSASPPVPATGEPPSATGRSPTRVGQVNISAWLNADFKSGLRLVQARKGPSATVQGILAEALNDLFAKYDVPTVQPD
jgi:hypothetical protein